MAKGISTVSVDQRAVTGRVKRALRKEGKDLQSSRRNGTTNFLVIADDRIVMSNESIEELARELGCLREWEEME